jgi:hypothetical protein
MERHGMAVTTPFHIGLPSCHGATSTMWIVTLDVWHPPSDRAIPATSQMRLPPPLAPYGS